MQKMNAHIYGQSQKKLKKSQKKLTGLIKNMEYFAVQKKDRHIIILMNLEK